MADFIISVGIDPGLASTGIGAVARFTDGSYKSLGVRLSRTTPEHGGRFTRQSVDDQRRIREHWVQIHTAIEAVKPQVIGIENYSTFEPAEVRELKDAAGSVLSFLGTSVPTVDDLRRVLTDNNFILRFADVIGNLAAKVGGSGNRGGIGLGQAAKTIAVFGAAMGAAFTAGIPVYVFQPSDIKRFGGGRSASKEDVGRGLEARVVDLQAHVAEKVPQKTLKEHVWDASAHAVLAADAYVAMLGANSIS